MTITTAILIVKHFQRWRRGDTDDMPDPEQVGIAIDVLIKFANQKLCN